MNQQELKVKLVERTRRFVAATYGVIVAFLLSPCGVPLHAQTAGTTTATPMFRYDAAEEITLAGTVAKVLATGQPGLVAGAHFLLQTSEGLVDASLGRFALEGKSALTLAAGQQVEATGVRRRIEGTQVFMVRTVEVQGEVYVIRNEHGSPLSPQARGRASRKADGDGGAL